VFVAALSEDFALTHALRRASAAGALACTRLGAQSSIPARAEVDAFLSANATDDATAARQLAEYCGMSSA
jgi:ribokinase